MPGDNQTVFKLVLFLGFVFVFSSLLAPPWVYVNQPIPANSTWGRIQTQVEAFPQFNTPSNSAQIQNLGPVGDFWPNTGLPGGHPWKVVNNANVGDCVNATNPDANYWGCLFSADTTGSYAVISTNVSRSTLIANLSSPASNANNILLSATATIQCRQEWGKTLPLIVQLFILNAGTRISILNPINPDTTCPINDWGYVKYSWDLGANNLTVGTFSTAALEVQVADTNQTVDISWVQFTVAPSNTRLCGGGLDGIACNAGNFAWSFLNTLLMLGAGVVFFVQLIVWFIGAAGVFFGAIPALFGVGGAPPIVTGFVGILLVGVIFYIALVMFGKVRGQGTTG